MDKAHVMYKTQKTFLKSHAKYTYKTTVTQRRRRRRKKRRCKRQKQHEKKHNKRRKTNNVVFIKKETRRKAHSHTRNDEDRRWARMNEICFALLSRATQFKNECMQQNGRLRHRFDSFFFFFFFCCYFCYSLHSIA